MLSRLLLRAWSALARPWGRLGDWFERKRSYDVGHGQGCRCEGCAARRRDREAW